MSLTRRIGYGSSLAVDPAGGSSFTTIAGIVDGWTGPNVQADEIETTILSDTYKKYARGQIDPGELSFEIAYDPEDATSQMLVDLYNDCTVATWQVTLSATCDAGGGTVTESFSGWVKSFSIKATKSDLVKAEVTIRLSGNPGLTGTSS